MQNIIMAFASPEAIISLVTLIFLEIVLGIDNIVFISITSDRLPEYQQHIGRRLGLAAAMVTRILLLLSLNWIVHLTKPLFDFGPLEITGKNIILLVGGAYLIFKGITEIRDMLLLKEEREELGHPDHVPAKRIGLGRAIATIAAMDVVFSLDSVITAVGLSGVVPIMVTAIAIAIIFMMVLADAVSDFINEHPEIKLLALFFILAIGLLLVSEFFGVELDEWYVYIAMFFSLVVTLLQMRYRTNLNNMIEEIRVHKEEFGNTPLADELEIKQAAKEAQAAKEMHADKN